MKTVSSEYTEDYFGIGGNSTMFYILYSSILVSCSAYKVGASLYILKEIYWQFFFSKSYV